MLRIIPSGGVSAENLGDFMRAGCVAVGVGTKLVSKEILRKRDWKTLRTRAAALTEAVQNARKNS